MRTPKGKTLWLRVSLLTVAFAVTVPGWLRAQQANRVDVTSEEVKQAIDEGVRYLKSSQTPQGSWPDTDNRVPNGVTPLATLALLTAGVPPDDPNVARALAYLERFSAVDLGKTYSVSLQTMVFAAADPERYKVRIAENAAWLIAAQHRAGDQPWPGCWSYDASKGTTGDNSNSQYALLGLNAAAEAGIPVPPVVWELARQYWESGQKERGFDTGGWNYHPRDGQPVSGSMTCAGISSLIISGTKRYQGLEILVGDEVRRCGEGGTNPELQRGIDWLSANFAVSENINRGQEWKYYYLYGLERAGRLSGTRFFGGHDWYRAGAWAIVNAPERHRLQGMWSSNSGSERDPNVTTSFVLLFLAKGRAPVVINKLRHGPGNDWNNDHDDIRNLVDRVSRDWKHLLTWQVVDAESATLQDLLQAPILYMSGHEAPEFSPEAKKKLRQYVEQGGFIFAEQCCGPERTEFDRGFRQLMEEIFPEQESGYRLHPLPDEHAIWRSHHILTPEVHPLWGIEFGCRTVVVYTPNDLSCYWNQMETQPANPAVIRSERVGENVVDYATGRELPADKLAVREITKFDSDAAKRGALHIAKLKHAGDWNVAPLAVPNLTTVLRDELKLDVVINHRAIFAVDPNLIYYPLVYLHGRAAFSFQLEELDALRRHLDPGGGTLFADAACGSPAFDAAFRQFAATIYPDNPLVPIPPDDELYTKQCGFDLSDVQYTPGAGGGKGLPQLEGVRINGHWAIIYSKYDIGCALEKHAGSECKGYTHESAMRIAANVVVYSTLP